LSLVIQSDALGIHRWEKEKIKFGDPEDPPRLSVEKSWLVDAADLNLPEGTKLHAIECSRYE
jgi:hypothetical protein